MYVPRLVMSMPPATPHMDKLAAGTAAVLPAPLPLHAVVWAPRADNKKVFNPWLKDALVKQGMYTQVRTMLHLWNVILYSLSSR